MTAPRVLVALLDAYERDGRATCRSLADDMGLAFSTVYAHLGALQQAGLVDWAEKQGGTLRPLVARLDAWTAPAVPEPQPVDIRDLMALWDELANTGAADGPSKIEEVRP